MDGKMDGTEAGGADGAGEAAGAADEAAQARQAALFAFLDTLGIRTTTHAHAPVFTVAEAQALRQAIPGAHTKNLFLKDKKDNYFLVTVEEEAEVDLKSIHGTIGAKSRVSFGKPEALMALLGVRPGAVTALGAFNDAEGRVRVVLDSGLMEHAVINVHPLSNDKTTSIGRDDLVTFLEATGHAPLVLKVTT
ncbi:MAG: prolyl-tRNA synthetase associated domain-containing protein [Pararhizobium sp.]